MFQGPAYLALWLIAFILGLILISLTFKKKVKGNLKKFLLLSGGSAAGFFVGVLLHNFLYGLATVAGGAAILSQLMGFFDVAFFLIAAFICPIGFVIGMVGSVVEFLRRGGEKI